MTGPHGPLGRRTRHGVDMGALTRPAALPITTAVVADEIGWLNTEQAAMATGAADVYRELAPAVLGYLRTQRAAEPEDLLGEVFLQVARDLPRFRGDDEHLRRWVFTLAHHRLVDDRRRRKVRPGTADAPVPDRPAPDDPAVGLDDELLAALARLTPEQREVVVLRFVADLPLVVVARITRRRLGAVKALQARGLDQLRRHLAP
jgi:RNA polymerase sigma factor (sigma-70 family)